MKKISWHTIVTSEYVLPCANFELYTHKHLLATASHPSVFPIQYLPALYGKLTSNTPHYKKLIFNEFFDTHVSVTTYPNKRDALRWMGFAQALDESNQQELVEKLTFIASDEFDPSIEEIKNIYKSVYRHNEFSAFMTACIDELLEPEESMNLLIDTDLRGRSTANISSCFNRLRPYPHDHEITLRRVQAIISHPELMALRNRYHKHLRRYDKLLIKIPSQRLFDTLHRNQDGSLIWCRKELSAAITLSYCKDADEALALTPEEPLAQKELIALIAMHYQAAPVDFKSLQNHLNIQRKLRNDRTDVTLPNALSHIHDPHIVPYMYELTRKGHHDMKPYLLTEGANAVEGLITMCTRKGAKRDFALHILSNYVEDGHGDMVRRSMTQLSANAAKAVEAALFSKDDAHEQEEHFYELDKETIEEKLITLSTFPFGTQQRIDLSYGGRAFKVHLDANADISVLDTETHKVVKKLPNARVDEDAFHINMFRDSLTARKKEARKKKREHLKYLEDRFRKMTYWDTASWEKESSQSALHASMASSFVWGIYDDHDTLLTTFYRDPQGKLLDTDYNDISLPEDARITLVHPLDMDPNELGIWSTFIADMERIQLFEQLARRVIIPDEWDTEKSWQAETFEGSEAMSIALRKYSGWYATYLRKGNQAKRWFAENSWLTRYKIYPLLVVHAHTWNAVSPEVPHRTGLHLIPFPSKYHTGQCVEWDTIPARIISELCLDLHRVAHKFGKPS